MATITKKANGTYLVRIYCGRSDTGRQLSKGRIFTPSKPKISYSKLNRELDEFIKAFEAELKQGIPDSFEQKNAHYFKDFCNEYMEIKSKTLSPGTFEFYTKVIQTHLIPLYGKFKLEEFRVSHVQGYIQYLSNLKRMDRKQDGLAPSTVKRYVTVLRPILSLAYKLEYIEKDISLSRRLEFPKAIPKSIEVFTFDEIQKILDALKEEPLGIRALIEVALYTGCRRGEIVGLKWSDIDFETKKVTIQRSIYKLKDQEAKEKCPKSISSIRSMIIPECLCQTLHEYREHQRQYKAYMGDLWKECDYLFTDAYGAVMHPHTPSKQFAHFLSRHGIRHLKFHGLRHTCATLLLASGLDIKTVSTRLGHADIETTGIYLHALESMDRKAADTFDIMARNMGQA